MEHHTQSDAEKPTVIGLYGLPGCGKSTMLRSTKDRFGTQSFDFLEGSDAIANVVPGGLEAFKALPATEKVDLREQAILKVAKDALAKGCVAVLAGHCSFWPAIDDTISWIFTEADASTHTHIIYLNTAAERIHEQCRSDSEKERETLSLSRLTEWQDEEKRRLREECYKHGIVLSVVSSTGSKSNLEQVCRLVDDFGIQTQQANMSSIETALTAALNGRTIETMLVFDGDRTISVEDTGSMFWNQVAKVHRSADLCDPLKRLFGSNLQYTHRAFEQCRILYEDTIHELGQATYDQICDEVAMAVTILPEVHALLQLSADVEHVGALVVTCGQSRIWKKVMERIGLSGKVQVIGGGCLSDGFVVTPAVKRAVVSRLQNMHQNFVWAFGDSPLDLDMLQKADEAIVRAWRTR